MKQKGQNEPLLKTSQKEKTEYMQESGSQPGGLKKT